MITIISILLVVFKWFCPNEVLVTLWHMVATQFFSYISQRALNLNLESQSYLEGSEVGRSENL